MWVHRSHAPRFGPSVAAAVNNFSHGYSGVRPAVVDLLIALLDHDCVPEVPARWDPSDICRTWLTSLWW